MDANERRERATREAAEWWQALEAGALSRAERERYVDWLRESAVHVSEMLRIARVHNALAQFQGWTNIATEAPDEEVVVALREGFGRDGRVTDSPRSADHAWRNRPRMKLFAAAAGLSAVAIAAGWLWLVSGGQVIETVRGERREVALGDGSVVQVDPETRLTVAVDEQRRHIVLQHGRALFRVAKDPQRPFVVQADGTRVRAVGTAFGVEREAQAITVTVTEGQVAVLSREIGKSPFRFINRETSATRNEEKGIASQGEDGIRTTGEGAAVQTMEEKDSGSGGILLVANEQVTVGPSGLAAAVRQVDSARELAWAEGRLVFEDDTVAEVIRDFNRYNLVQLRVRDEALAQRTISGVFDASDPESFIAFMQTVVDVKVVRANGQEITIASP